MAYGFLHKHMLNHTSTQLHLWIVTTHLIFYHAVTQQTTRRKKRNHQTLSALKTHPSLRRTTNNHKP